MNIQEQTVGSIVANNFKAASIFSKYQIDFCCGGKKKLIDVCAEKNVNAEDLAKELEALTADAVTNMKPFNQMTANELVSYILIHHHFYTKQNMPIILGHLQKVAYKHGERFPYMVKVAQLFSDVHQDMLQHMEKEEKILFPAIKALEDKTDCSFKNIAQPIHVMEAEHEIAGNQLEQIRQLTNGFTAPEDACTTFRISLLELKEFEENLHQHVHLENNILFPMAQQLAETPATCCIL